MKGKKRRERSITTHRTKRKESENIQQEIQHKKKTRDVKRREKKNTKQQHMYTDSTKHDQKIQEQQQQTNSETYRLQAHKNRDDTRRSQKQQ